MLFRPPRPPAILLSPFTCIILFSTHTIDRCSAWVFFKLMNVSGAEAVVAAGSPFIGQGESACLVKPYVDLMTESEIHLVMTSGTSRLCSFPVLRAISQ